MDKQQLLNAAQLIGIVQRTPVIILVLPQMLVSDFSASPHQLLIFDFFTLWAASSFEKNHKKSLSFEMTSDFFK